MTDAELDELAEDIRSHGLQHPITLLKGLVLDGRHRLRACMMAQVEPTYAQFTGSDPLGFVISQNLRRRHLNTSQRSMIAAEIANLPHGGNRQAAYLRLAPTQAAAAAVLNVSERSVNTAKQVLERGDEEVIQAVKTGAISVTAAAASLPPKAPTPPIGPSAEYEEALKRISAVWDAKTVAAVKDGILNEIDKKEAIFLAGLDDAEMEAIQELVVTKRWPPTKAHRFLKKMPDEKTRIGDLQNLAIAGGGKVLVRTGAFVTIGLNTRALPEEYDRLLKLLKFE